MGNPVKSGLSHRILRTISDWRIPGAKAAIIAGAATLYTFAHFLLFPVVSGNAAMIVVPTVLLVAWLFGARSGFVTRVFTLILTSLRVILHGVHKFRDRLFRGDLDFHATEVVGTIVGRLLDLNSRAFHELGRCRPAGEMLELPAQVRTAKLSGGIS